MTAPRDPRRGRWSDHEIEQRIGQLLQIGVAIATVVVLVGAAGVLARQWSVPVNYAEFRGEAAPLRSVGAVVRGAVRLDYTAVVQLGLILLIATPVARVALTLGAFVAQRDRLYVALTTVVLLLLLYGLFWGRG